MYRKFFKRGAIMVSTRKENECHMKTNTIIPKTRNNIKKIRKRLISWK